MMITTPLGQVLRDSDGMRLEFVRTYDAPLAAVWSALTDPERTARWIGSWSGDPASGKVSLTMSAEEGAPAEDVLVHECAPPTRLVVETATPDGPWLLTADLAEQSGTTTMTFVMRLAEPYDATAVGPGWHYYLDRLDAVVRDGEPTSDWDAYYPSLAEAYVIPE